MKLKAMVSLNLFPKACLLSFFFLLFSIGFPTQVFSEERAVVANEKIIIDKKVQRLTFFLNKKKELNAKLIVSENIHSETTLRHTFGRSVFFDENSEVKSIKRKAKLKKRKVDPIISDYESDGIFHSDLKLCYFEHEFTQNGEAIFIQYEKIFYDLKFLDPLYFNDLYFVENSEIIIEVPNWLKIDIRELNFDLESAKHSATKVKENKVHTYTLNQRPASFRHRGAPRRSKYNAHLIVIPNSYKAKGKNRKLIETVEDLYGWYASLVNQIGNKNQELKTLVSKLTNGKTEDLDKIKSIFYWVQDNIRYIAFENGIMGFKPESCQKVFNNKYGDCKGMANLTKEMLSLAGYDARLTWLGTSDIPYSYDIPALVVDNHMICTVILDGKKIFLDPTEKYADLYNYAFRIQGQEALIEDGEKFIIEKIPSFKVDHSKRSSNHNFSIDNTKLKGNGTVKYTGNRKTRMLYILSTIPQNKWEEYLRESLSNGDKNIQLSLKTQPSLKDRDANFALSYDMEIDNHIIDLGAEQYINMESDYEFQNFEMPEGRDVPYEFSGKYFIENTSTLKIPEAWKVTYLPEAILNENEKYTFSLSYKKENGQVVYQKRIEIKDAFLAVEDFKEWNQIIKALNSFYSDQIILNKK